jgi:hypothetical protein
MAGKHYRGLFGLVLALVLALGTGFVPTAAQIPPAAPAQMLETTFPSYQNEAIADAVAFLKTRQLENGSIDSFDFGADPGGSARLLMALNAVGYPAATLTSSADNTLLDYLASEVVNYIFQDDTPGQQNLFPGRAGLVLGGVAAAGGDPRDFGGQDLIALLEGAYNASEGTYSTSAQEGEFLSGAASDINQTLAIIGLIAAGRPIPTAATQWLIDNQNAAGSWSNSIDITGYAIVALIGSGNVAPTDPAIQRALEFYRTSQTVSTALWGDQGSGEPANSTGWSMTALATYGYTPMTDSWATGGSNPREALLGLQTDEGIIAGRFFNAYATLEGLYGLSDQPLFMTTPLRAERALAYLKSRQNEDGGWPGFGTDSSPGETIDNHLAFVSAGYDPAAITTNGNSPLDYLTGAAESYTRDDSDEIFPAQTGKLIVGVVAAGGDPANFGSPALNLTGDLTSTLQATGAYSSTASRDFATGAAGVTAQSFALLGLAAAGESVPTAAIDFLKGLQNANGSWGSPDNTGLALQALIAAGVAPGDQAIADAITWLRDNQAASGGWLGFSGVSVNSTAFAIQGLLAAGVDLTSAEWLKNGRSPLNVLASYQKTDGPFVVNWTVDLESGFNPAADNLFATQQAVPALLGATYPYTATAPADLNDSYTPLQRGPDPDRLVVASPYVTFNADRSEATLTAPFGSDLNGDGDVTVEWSVEAAGSQLAAFQEVDATRGPGYFRATVDVSGQIGASDSLVVRATFTDADGAQLGETLSTDPQSVTAEVEPFRVYLPIVALAP